MTSLPNPWIPEQRFTLDVSRFLEAIEPAPKFISDPSPGYLTAVELMPIVELLTKY